MHYVLPLCDASQWKIRESAVSKHLHPPRNLPLPHKPHPLALAKSSPKATLYARR
jgi:hypothetical protein